jgi:threonine/homoserine/homoserine lactone efflux protein
VAALGLASVSAFVLAHERQLHGLAGIFLLYLGLKGLLARPKLEQGTSRKLSGSWPLAFSSSLR